MWQESRNWVAKFGNGLVLTLLLCAVAYGQDVRTNYMPGTVWEKYHTYKWVNQVGGVPTVGGHPDDILDTQVKEAVDAQMAAKGFTKVESGKADLLLGYQLVISQEKQINGFANGWGGGWGGWGPWGAGLDTFSASTATINVGTFVLGMYDPDAKKLVWIGAAQHTLEPSKKQEKNQQKLDKGAQKLLKDFPPRQK